MAAPVERSAERLKFFTDAVVAIAMTLLILPLIEAVSESAREGLDTAEFLEEHSDQLWAFVLSFVIIAVFWVQHERLFAHVERWTTPLLVLHVGWMLTIVFLPVATALTGSMETDRAQTALYIGTMLATSLIVTAQNVLIRRQPQTWADDVGPSPRSVLGQATAAGLFGIALLGSLVVGPDYRWLLVLLLSGPVQRIVNRRPRR